jgi:hypothetical protein
MNLTNVRRVAVQRALGESLTTTRTGTATCLFYEYFSGDNGPHLGAIHAPATLSLA